VAPIHEVRGGAPGRAVGVPGGDAPAGPRTPTTAATFAGTVGPLARAAELELRLREETLRRERAEARAQHAEALAEVAGSRLALLESRVAAAEDERAAESADRDAVVATLRDGLAEVGAELDALRGLAASADRAAVEAPRGTADPRHGADEDAAPVRTRSALDPSIRMGELARGARELLAGGRIEAADEVIRGLEDAAARLRAQAPPPSQD
jgi:hypothetical protein